MKTYSLTDIGIRREMNQDYFFSSEEPVGRLPNLFIVADGMGGHRAGELASRCAVETMAAAAHTAQESDTAGILTACVAEANTRLHQYAKEHPVTSGMGTTIVAAVLDGRHLTIVNVGDSRLYLIGTDIRQITRDHSLVEEMVRMGELQRKDARSHPDKNVITRAVGVKSPVRIDFFDVKLEEGDVILLCSDGLTNMVEDAEILQIVRKYSLPKEAACHLVNEANKNGGKDNISVVLAEV
ncbi:MAG: Stp1/IreP family PP2C-type Ser/Thr phosphatase [Lachnospiraceae bacterium]|nr:Stp1/IreP family PP2C-type Ser/Thr phosphatase [Lachnospiraceae bacterium]